MKKALNIFISVFIFASLLFLSGCMKSFNFSAEYNKGLKAYKEKDYEKAIVSLNKALEANPRSYSTHCLLGLSYGFINDYPRAENVLKRAVKEFPNDWNAYIFLGDVKRSERKYQEALEYYQTAVGLPSMPDDDRVYYQNMIADVIKEQNRWNYTGMETQEQRLARFLEEKKKLAAMRLYSGEDKVSSELPKPAEVSKDAKPDELINLDWTQWENAVSVSNQSMILNQYGLKGEDVKNFQWSELVTVQYFPKGVVKEQNAKAYLESHLKSIADMAKGANKNFKNIILIETPDEVFYEWKFDDGKESEVARILYTDKGIYHYHYAKKGVITPEERTRWIEVLKKGKVYK